MSALHVLGLAIAGLLADIGTSPSEPLDRIVAVVNEQPIFASELRQRARPAMTAGKAEALRVTLERMIDERLEEKEAARSHIHAESADIDTAIEQIGKQTKMSRAELLAEVKRQGMTEPDYRAEVGRQILEGKLIQLRVRSRVRVTEADARTIYASWVKEQTGSIDLRIIALGLSPDASADAKKAKESLAADLAKKANAGADFCKLVQDYTDDPSTKTTCGSRGPLRPAMLTPELAAAGAKLKPGETAAPILFKDPAGSQGYLIVQRAPGPAGAPTFESVKTQMMDRAMGDAVERERRLWLQDLRKAAFIEVRL